MMNYRKVILISCICGLFFILKDIYKEDNIRLEEVGKRDKLLIEKNFDIVYTNNLYTIDSNIEIYNNELSYNEEKSLIYNDGIMDSDIPKEHLGFEVDCELEIPVINLKTYVFKQYSESAMNLCPTKLWGPNPNCIGNYSIVGHNYKKENMFNKLIELKMGDEIFVTENTTGKNKYKVTDIYKVKANNVEPIKQNSKNNIELTLITCVNYTNNRLIIKAQKY